MELKIKRDSILLVPESKQDKAFLEDTLGLKFVGAKAVVEVEKYHDMIGFEHRRFRVKKRENRNSNRKKRLKNKKVKY